jgi:integrase/recombinase XerD
MQTRAILEVTDITEEDLLGFMLEVKKRKSNFTGEGLASATVSFYVTYVKNFFRYLKEKNLILVDPSKKLRFARRGVKLPRGYFTEKEMQSILKAIDINDILGIRDRALLELLYSTGLRSQEILSLNVEDVDFAKELVFVGFGKGGKERMTPVGKHALFWVGHYLENARSKILRGREVPGLFVSLNRKIMENYHLNQRIRIYKAKAGVGKIGGAHLFRHSCATHMLQHGADIRYVQEMLGHERISTTSVYTKVSLVHLKEAYHKVFV